MKFNIKLFIIFSMSFLLISASPKNSKSVKSETKKVSKDVSVSSTTVRSAQTSVNSSDLSSVEVSGVMVDNLSDEDIYDTTSDKQDDIENNADGIPYSYGVIKGTINIDGKSTVVMEQEDGGINLIQIYIEKGSLKWKLIGQIKRS